jgi:hypothetical protein
VQKLNPFASKDKAKSTGEDVDYELSHFVRMGVQGNPTVLEVLWSAAAGHADLLTPPGEELVKNRHRFLDKTAIFNAHRGYAASQVSKLDRADERRLKKLVVAYVRVMDQGIELLTYGDFNVTADPWLRDWKQSFTVDKMPGFDMLREDLEGRLRSAYDTTKLGHADIDWIKNHVIETYLGHRRHS